VPPWRREEVIRLIAKEMYSNFRRDIPLALVAAQVRNQTLGEPPGGTPGRNRSLQWRQRLAVPSTPIDSHRFPRSSATVEKALAALGAPGGAFLLPRRPSTWVAIYGSG
jgi:hypothetical protein